MKELDLLDIVSRFKLSLDHFYIDGKLRLCTSVKHDLPHGYELHYWLDDDCTSDIADQWVLSMKITKDGITYNIGEALVDGTDTAEAARNIIIDHYSENRFSSLFIEGR